MEPKFNSNPEIKPITEPRGLDWDNLNKMHDLKVTAMQLLFESHSISREVQMQIKDIFDKVQLEQSYLVGQLVDYLNKKNPKIFAVDNLMKAGHEPGKSASIAEINLTDEDMALLEWFQQVRM